MACRPYNTGRCLLLRLFNPSKLWGSLHDLSPWHLSPWHPRGICPRGILKMALGKLTSFASHAKWIHWFDKLVASSKDGHPWGIPTGRKYYNGEIFDKSVFVPVKKAMFEGLEVNIPNDVHRYLTNLYKNYMELPPIEKRERHFICDFQLPQE